MTPSSKFICEHHSGRGVEFNTYQDALRFVLRRGDASELWTIREVSTANFDTE